MLSSGWNMPPGCFRVPGDEPVYCEVCHQYDDGCVCPECPVCGEIGEADCYAEPGHGLKLSRAQKIAIAKAHICELEEQLNDAHAYLDYLETGDQRCGST